MASTLARRGSDAARLRTAEESILKAVFPIHYHAQPTPQASPYIGASSSPLQDSIDDVGDTAAARLMQHETAWSIVTRWLSVNGLSKDLPPHLNAALDVLVGEQTSSHPDFELVSWLVSEVKSYFSRSVQPNLWALWSQTISLSQAQQTLERTASVLSDERKKILRPLDAWLASNNARGGDLAEADGRARLIQHFRQSASSALCTEVRQAVPAKKLLGCLTSMFTRTISTATTEPAAAGIPPPYLALLSQLGQVGLAGDLAQRALALSVQAAINIQVHSYSMRVDWVTQSSRVPDLLQWISGCLRPIVRSCMGAIIEQPQDLTALEADITTWQRMALTYLGQARLDHLMSYVQLWPQSLGAILDLRECIALPDSKVKLATTFMSQLEDKICHAGATTAELLDIYVAVIRVCKTLDNRSVLLEKVSGPLRSFLRERDDTVRVIAASFLAELDENEALLISVTAGKDEVCVELTKEVLRSEAQDLQPEKSLDWDDMAWLPDPIDAGPDYKTNKNNDIVSYMLTLFEREVFVKEVQNILGERLLRSEDQGMATERRLVDMLKGRLGADKLQAAEVMVRDMADSARIGRHLRSVNSKIPTATQLWEAIPESGAPFADLLKRLGARVPANEELKRRFIDVVGQAATSRDGPQGLLLFRRPDFRPTTAAGESGVEDMRFEAKVLSSFFWPELRDDEFKIPPEIERTQEEYERGFRRIKTQRRLKWMSALGRVTVELELSDRTVKLEGIKTWVAAVIYAFQTPESAAAEDGMDIDEGAHGTSSPKTVAQLEEELNMDEVLVRNALNYWVGQRVLKEVETDTFSVMEAIDDAAEQEVGGTSAASAQQARPEEAVSALKSQDAVLKDNRGMYEMFIVGMLTNGGAMDAGRVAMMLKMVVPGGFTFGEEGVTWLLQGMEGDGKVARNGDAWTIKK